MTKIIGISFMIVGVFIIIYRQYIRYRAHSITLFQVEPYCIWETVRGWGFYGYKCKYNNKNSVYEIRTIEFGIYFWTCPSKSLPISKGVISTGGRVSCDDIYSIEKTGLILLVIGFCAYIG